MPEHAAAIRHHMPYYMYVNSLPYTWYASGPLAVAIVAAVGTISDRRIAHGLAHCVLILVLSYQS
jgi:hypothetical protein